jgi:hypothetical protein
MRLAHLQYVNGRYKVAKFERVEWIVQPDETTAALQKGEVDWSSSRSSICARC